MKIKHFEEIKGFFAGVAAAFVFYAAGLYMTPHLLHLRYPRLFVLGVFAVFFLAGAVSRVIKPPKALPNVIASPASGGTKQSRFKSAIASLLLRLRRALARNAWTFKIAGWAGIAVSVIAIIKMGAVKELVESFLYGWRYFLALPEYARNFSADCLLLAVLTAWPALLLGRMLFPDRKNKIIPFFSGVILSGFLIVNFFPAHRYEVAEKLPERLLKKDGRVIMDNRLSSIACERLKVYLPFILGGAGIKSALFIGAEYTEAVRAAESLPAIQKIICLEPNRYLKLQGARVKTVRKSLKDYLSSSRDTFDLIVINSEDFPLKKNADLLKGHLAAGGFLVAALPLNRGDTDSLKSSLAEYREFFGEATVWMPHPTLPRRLLVLCRKKQLGLDARFLKEAPENITRDEKFMRDLSGININNIFDLLDMLVLSEEDLSAYVRPVEKSPPGEAAGPLLKRLAAPTARQVRAVHRGNIMDIMRARSRALGLFNGEIPENARETLTRYHEATTNTVFGQVYKEMNGFFDLGALEFRSALKISPFDGDAAYALGIPGTFGNLIANSRARFTPATEDLFKGKTLLMEEKIAPALDKFREAVGKDPFNELARSCLAGAYQMAGEPDKALQEYKAIINSAGDFNLPPINDGSLESIAVYRALEEVALGIYHWDKGNMKEFMRSVRSVIGFGYDPAVAFPEHIAESPVFKRNLAYLKTKTAVAEEGATLEILGGYYSSMAHIYWLRGRCIKAVIYANGALRATQRSELKEMIYSDLGTYFAEAGELESAEEYYKKALEINPNIPHVNKYLKINSLELKRKKGPEDAALLTELAQSYKDIFDLGKNVQYLEEALALDKNSKEIKFKYDEAVLQRMLSLNPDDAGGHNVLGVLYWSHNEPYKAIQSFMIALEINPYFADAHFNLAMAYRDAGDKKNEAKHLKKALKFKPSMVIARQELEKIK